MKICAISDTHCQLSKVTIPVCDILVHSGDLTYRGTYKEMEEEFKILGKAQVSHKIFVAGNHDWLAEEAPEACQELCDRYGIIWLQGKEITIDGIKFYGDAYQPEFCGWAFNKSRGEKLKQIWDRIPNDVNYLITHSPAHGILDMCRDGTRVGCWDLFNRISDLKELKFHQAGHIHLGYGIQKDLRGYTAINASCCNEQYKPINTPIVFEYYE